MKIGVEVEEGKLSSFFFDGEILNGLYFVDDESKAIQNIKEFGIELRKLESEKMLGNDLYVRGDVCILIIHHKDGPQLQYLIAKDLNLMDLIAIPNDDFPSETKEYIIRGRELLG